MKNISDDNLWNEKEDISFDGIINNTVQNSINKIIDNILNKAINDFQNNKFKQYEQIKLDNIQVFFLKYFSLFLSSIKHIFNIFPFRNIPLIYSRDIY